VERREDPDDRRRRIVSIADTARPAIEGWLGPGAAAWRQALQPLTPAERRLVVDTLRAYDRAVSERSAQAG
jgi:DNA-binding MarR family transcriptional regulator